MKSIFIEQNPFAKIKIGVDKLANVVRETLGPSGKNILIDRENKPPLSTRDGVTVAHHVILRDRLENFGASLVKQAARNTNNEAGDGTTTSVILAQAIFTEGLKYVAAGINPIEIKRSIDSAVITAVDRLNAIKKEISTYEDIKAVASISANNDSVIGSLIATAIDRVRDTGTVLVEDSTNKTNSVKFQEGMVIERGWGDTSHYFVTNIQKGIAEYENPYIIIIDDKIHSMEQLLPVMKWVAKEKKPLILSVRDVEDTVLAWLVANKLKNGLPICVIKTPGHNNIELIEDFAYRVGTRPFNPDWNNLNLFNPENLGSAKRVIVGPTDTTIVEGCGNISERLIELNEKTKAEEDPLRKTRYQDRINKT
jgi:chaperonin GroEL